jgi:group I intron endonuclease
MSTGIIYMYTSLSGKRYVGQTWNEQKRRWEHRSISGKKSVFHEAIKKYGKDSFVYDILHSNIETQEELNRLESETIARFNTIAPHGYNLTTGGEGGKHHKASKQKLKDMWLTTKRDQMVNSMKRTAERPEVKARLKQNAINNASNPEIMKQRSQKLKVAFSSKEVRKQRSEQRKQEWANPEIRAKRLEGHVQARSKESYKLRQIEIMKKRWESDEYRLQMKKKLTGRVISRSEVDEKAKKRMVKVVCINTGEVFESVNAASKFANVSRSCISSVITGKQKQAGGYRWEYAKK